MDRWDWMYVRAYAPMAAALLAALVSAKVVAGLQASSVLAGVASFAKWVPMVLFVAAVLYGLWVTYRLWQAHNGEGLLCECGGLLGWERAGRADRGGAYRRCYACQRDVNHHRYG